MLRHVGALLLRSVCLTAGTGAGPALPFNDTKVVWAELALPWKTRGVGRRERQREQNQPLMIGNVNSPICAVPDLLARGEQELAGKAASFHARCFNIR
jgi:hypothetical protein